ncbi:MAG: SGNH/GDSL hydrolase family protein [Acidobacteriota bacterium]
MMTLLSRSYALLAFLFVAVSVVNAQQQYSRAHLWEKEIDAFAEADGKTLPRRTEVLFTGSSSIRAWKSVATDFADFSSLNRGFGGSHLEDVVFYTPRIVVPYKPKVIVLYAGENDLTAGKTVARVFEDFNSFVLIVRKNLPKTRIIFVSLKPSPSRWRLRGQFQQLNELIKKKISGEKRLQYVDVWGPMLDANGEARKDIFQSDGLHMNAEGYEIWRRVLAPHIRQGVQGNFR